MYGISVLDTCRVHEYTCANGQCIAVDELCDFKYDCVDGSDEDASVCGNVLPDRLVLEFSFEPFDSAYWL